MEKPEVTFGHMLSAVRMDVWLKLVRENRIDKQHIPQALVITLESALLTPLAYIEYVLTWIPVHVHTIKKDPVYIVGFWRSGTSYLHNLITRDPQWAWFDPVSTMTFGNSFLLRKPLTAILAKNLKGARVMDNLEYEIDLPMEEGLAMSGITTLEVSHMMAFPDRGRGTKYIHAVFVDAMNSSDRRRFWQIYHYILKKVSWMKGGRQLCLKSPDNTARIAFLKRAYPGAKFINIYRNPYVVVRSAVHMFSTEMKKFAISEPCSDQYLLDRVCVLFERVYRRAFRELDRIPEADKVDIKYEDFVDHQEEYMKKIYDKLGLDGYEKAAPYFQEYIDSMRDYKTNTYDYPPELIRKVNERLGFYFERYGYEMLKPDEV